MVFTSAHKFCREGEVSWPTFQALTSQIEALGTSLDQNKSDVNEKDTVRNSVELEFTRNSDGMDSPSLGCQ